MFTGVASWMWSGRHGKRINEIHLSDQIKNGHLDVRAVDEWMNG